MRPAFPTTLHQDTAGIVLNYFLPLQQVDTVLVVNSCARGQSVPESDLDFAILVKPSASPVDISNIYEDWVKYSSAQPIIQQYKRFGPYAHLHLDLIDGRYIPAEWELGVPPDSYELEIGNQICYSAPMEKAGNYFQELQNKYLPYYDEEQRLQRLARTRSACEYDLNHIPFLVRRRLFFHAFDTLYMAFQKYLQSLFIAHRTYPVAYNKWIKDQVVNILNKPDLYPYLSPLLSVQNIESNELVHKAEMLRELLVD